MPRTRDDWLIFIIRLIIGGFFIYASVDKILNPDAFAKIIHNYRILPPEFINVLAIILPWVEIISGFSLIIGFKYRGANLIIMVLLAVFIVALTASLIRGLNINCGCFTTSSTAKSDLLWRIIEDVFMLIGCILISLKHKIFNNLSPRFT
jgi:uncharacterized membrane protein YphA (DoxX/SURF4 family)